MQPSVEFVGSKMQLMAYFVSVRLWVVCVKWKTYRKQDPFLIYWQKKVIHIPNSSNYRQVSNIRRTLIGNEIVDHSDVVAPTTSSFST